MSTQLRLLAACALLGCAAPTAGCTLVKPVVCAVTTPARALTAVDLGPLGACDARALACAFAVAVGASAAAGAAGGLITGAMSDYYYLTGDTQDPSRNLHDAFATNRSALASSR